MNNCLITLLIALFCHSTMCWAASCKALLNRSDSARIENIKKVRGLKFKLTVENGATTTRQTGRFLGYNDSNETYYFMTEPKGQILGVAAESIEFGDNKARALPSGLAQKFDSLILKVRRQTDVDCAVHSSVSSVEYLRSEGLLPLDNSLCNATTDGLFAIFRHTHAVYMAQRRMQAYTINQNSGRGFFGRLLFGARAKSQTQVRAEIYSDHGIASKIIRPEETKELLKHLRSGRPAVFDLPVAAIDQTLGHIVDANGVSERGPTEVLVPRPATLDGWHSFLALTSIKLGWMSERILVLDTFNGQFYLWPPRFLKECTLGQVTLVAVGN